LQHNLVAAGLLALVVMGDRYCSSLGSPADDLLEGKVVNALAF